MLVGSDLAPWSEGIAIHLRIYRDRLVITNPGGLYGITVDRLGREAISRSRNAKLVALGVNVSAPGGVRVVESLASGLIRVNAELDDQGLPRPVFVDTGIQFTAIVKATRHHEPRARASSVELIGAKQQQVLTALVEGGRLSVAGLVERTGLSSTVVRRAVTALREKRMARVASGGRGRETTYEAV